jgi:tetratricopeptide (TPR) repeat protein
MTNVDELREQLASLHALDDRYGGGAVDDYAVKSARSIYAAFESHRMSERIERALHSVAGTYISTAGWFAYDAGDHVTAGHRFDRALRSALVSRDSMLQAQTWNYMSLHAARVGRPAEALAIAKAGLSSTLARRQPKVAALFHTRVALRLAKRGERGAAERSLAHAFNALDRDDGRASPPWLAFLDAAELTGLSALARLYLGQYRLAEADARESLSLLEGPYARNRLYYTVQLAQAQLGTRQIEQACSTAHEALDLASDTRSSRSLNDLGEFRSRLAVWNTPEARDWMERLDTVQGRVR